MLLNQRRPEFVIVVDTKNRNKTIRMDDLKELEAFLYRFSSEDVAICIWESLQFTYKRGIESGIKKS